MSKHAPFVFVLTLPFLFQAADQKNLAPKYTDIRIMQKIDGGAFSLCTFTLSTVVGDEATIADVENIIIHFTHNKELVIAHLNLYHRTRKLKDIETYLEKKFNSFDVIVSKIPHTFKQLKMRELTGKPIRGARKPHQ